MMTCDDLKCRAAGIIPVNRAAACVSNAEAPCGSGINLFPLPGRAYDGVGVTTSTSACGNDVVAMLIRS